MYTTSTDAPKRAKKPLSDLAVRVLRAVAFPGRDPREQETLLEAADGDKHRMANAVVTLRDRWLVTYDGSHVRPTQRGKDLLRTAAYRNRGLE